MNPKLLLVLLISLSKLSVFGPQIVQADEKPAKTRLCDHYFAQFPFLKEGKYEGFLPKLVLSEQNAMDELIGRFDKKGVLIITSPHFDADAKRLAKNAKVTLVENPTIEEVARIQKLMQENKITTVIGVGGGVATDIAKAVGVDRDLYLFHSLLSTNCISNNRTVLGNGINSFSYAAGTPREVIINMPDILRLPPAEKAKWTRAGYGDHVAELSAAMEQELEAKGAMARFADVISHDPKTWSSVQWVNNQKKSGADLYDRQFIENLAGRLHNASIGDIQSGSNSHRIGSEHAIYKTILELDPKLRFTGPPHGTITAIASLAVAKIFGNLTGDVKIYDSLRTSFAKTGIPITYSQMSEQGLPPEILERSIEILINKFPDQYIVKNYLASHGAKRTLDSIFSER